jgi:hypothetical protein
MAGGAPLAPFAALAQRALGGANETSLLTYVAQRAYIPGVNASQVLDEVEAYVAHLDPRVVDVAAGAGIVFGLVFALVGARFVRLGCFLVGSLLGLAFGSIVAGRIRDIESGPAVALILSSGLTFGVLMMCMLRLAKVLIGASFGLALAAFFNDTGAVKAIGSDGFLVAMLIVIVLGSAIVSYLVFQWAVGAACATVGAFIWTISLNHFVETGIVLRIALQNPSSVGCASDNATCWGVLVSGLLLAVVGTLLSWSARCAADARGSTAVYKAVKEAGLEDSGAPRTGEPAARYKRSRALIAPRPPRFATVSSDSGDEEEPRNPTSVKIVVERTSPI